MEKEEALRLIKAHEWTSGSAPAVYQFCQPFMVGFMRVRNVYKHYYQYVFLTFTDEVCKQLTPEEHTYNHIKQLYDDPERTRKIKQEWETNWAAFREWCPVAIKNIETLNEQELAQRYEAFMERFFDLWAPTLPVDIMGTYTETTLLQEFLDAVKLPESEAVEQYAFLCLPSQQSFVVQEHLSLLKLAVKRDEKALAAHQAAWFWIENNYRRIKVLSKEYFRSKIDEIQKSEEEIEKERERLTADHCDEQEAVCKKLGVSGKLKDDILLTRTLTIWQDQRREMQMRGNHYLNEILKEIAARVKLDLETLYFATYDEVEKMLRTGKKVPAARLSERSKQMVCVMEQPETETIFEGEEAQELIEAFEKKRVEAALRGIVACKGTRAQLQGIVRVVIDVTKEKFSQGEILVTTMTRPEFVPLMRKAAAIVTDEGGITSHAAIVSRELGIPCVIGTKHATKSLKSGDRVGIDLLTGTITRL